MSAPPPHYQYNGDMQGMALELCPEHCSGAVWPAAQALLQHLEVNDATLPRDAAVLELGSGTGWLALKMAQRRGDLRWCATEIEEHGAADRLARNIAGGGERVRAAPLDWNRAEQSPLVKDEKFDLVVGSDLVYSEEGAASLVSCLSCLLLQRSSRHPPDVIIAQTCGRWGGYGYDTTLFECLQRASLVATPVGGETLEGSVERRQHVVVFKVSAALHRSDGEDEEGNATVMHSDSHVLLRAKRLQAMADEAMLAAMSEEERAEMEAAQLLDGMFE